MISILIVSKKNDMPDYYAGAITEYTKRLTRYCNLTMETLDSTDELEPLVSSFHTIRVHAKGQALDSVSFSEQLQNLSTGGHSKIALILNMNYDADLSLSLSTLSLSPELSLVCMLEQIYRAFRIWYGEPYHK